MSTVAPLTAGERRVRQAPPPRPALTVVVPVVDGAATIVENVGVIRRAVETRVDGDIELIVVSDGSVDDTAERLLSTQEETRARVIHYDRNLGKGYAVRAGALAARGEWIAFIDSDLDIDPASIATYLDVARAEKLHFAIGSKRHPESSVHYPRSRRIASWCYQKLNRILFRLDVQDTQVGLKVFHREIAEQVMPLLLVKQFAFDLELLAVSRALGYDRVRELPVRLDYRFTGSGVRSRAVAMALIDTAAIFYRLRILRTYQRKRDLLGIDLARPAERRLPLVSLVGADIGVAERLDYPSIELVEGVDIAAAVRSASGDLVAVMPAGGRPAGNWLAASVAFFARPQLAGVVTPAMAPLHGPARQQAAAAVLESRLGAGSRRIRFSPGNLRTVVDYPGESIVARRDDYVRALDAGVEQERLVAWLAAHGREVVYTPEAMMVVSPAPLFRGHLGSVFRYARARGASARYTGGRSLSPLRFVTMLPFGLGLAAIPLVLAGGTARTVGVVCLSVYLAALVLGAAIGALRFHSVQVGLLTLPALAASHVAYVAGFAAGVLRSMTSRTLSVVIPAYNAEVTIGGTIDALAAALAEAPSFDAELVLVDDGSTDATAETARTAAHGRVPIRVLSQPNRGRFEARRAGLAAAAGDWVLLLDSRITLRRGSLAFVAERIEEGDRVWNGHVHVLTDGNPYGAFWKVVVEVAWRDYLASPRTTSFGVTDFDRYPKGTGCFVAPREVLVQSMEQFTSHYADLRAVSDDTAVIRWIAEREPIHLSPHFDCDYEARSTLATFFRQGLYRGTTFVDGHLRPESRFFPGAVAFFPISILLAIAVFRRPTLAPAAAVAGGVAAGLAATAARCSPYEVRSVSWLAPVYAVAHGAGMWRGLAKLAEARLRSDR